MYQLYGWGSGSGSGVMMAAREFGTDHAATNEAPAAPRGRGGGKRTREGFGASDAVCIMHAFAPSAAHMGAVNPACRRVGGGGISLCCELDERGLDAPADEVQRTGTLMRRL